jgi:hypothetical protein
LPDDLDGADLTAARDPVLVEWLEGESCGPRGKTLVMRAVHASAQCVSAARWRRDLLTGHPSPASVLLAEAGACMHSAGLWPWPGGEEG